MCVCVFALLGHLLNRRRRRRPKHHAISKYAPQILGESKAHAVCACAHNSRRRFNSIQRAHSRRTCAEWMYHIIFRSICEMWRKTRRLRLSPLAPVEIRYKLPTRFARVSPRRHATNTIYSRVIWVELDANRIYAIHIFVLVVWVCANVNGDCTLDIEHGLHISAYRILLAKLYSEVMRTSFGRAKVDSNLTIKHFACHRNNESSELYMHAVYLYYITRSFLWPIDRCSRCSLICSPVLILYCK